MQEEFDFAISCASEDVELAAALYRRLIERIPRRRVYFYRLRPPAEQRLTGENLLRHLQSIYSSSKVVIFIIGNNHASMTDWEAATAMRRHMDGSPVRLFTVTRSGCALPTMLQSLGVTAFPDPISKDNELCDINRVAKAVVHNHFSQTSATDGSKPSSNPPIVVRRHIDEFVASNDYKRDFELANADCANSCDVARTGVHSTAALLGSAEQYERLIGAANGLRKIIRLTNVDELELTFPFNRRRHQAWQDARVDACYCVEEALLANLVSRLERRIRESRETERKDSTLLLPDALQLMERLNGYLSRYLDGKHLSAGKKFVSNLNKLLGFEPMYPYSADQRDGDRNLLRDIHRLAKEVLEGVELSMTKYSPSFGLPEIAPNLKAGSLLQRLREIALVRESSQSRHR